MKNNKILKELNDRLEQLEREFNVFVSAISLSNNAEDSAPTYEEVIDLWLNGKSQA